MHMAGKCHGYCYFRDMDVHMRMKYWIQYKVDMLPVMRYPGTIDEVLITTDKGDLKQSISKSSSLHSNSSKPQSPIKDNA